MLLSVMENKKLVFSIVLVPKTYALSYMIHESFIYSSAGLLFQSCNSSKEILKL